MKGAKPFPAWGLTFHLARLRWWIDLRFPDVIDALYVANGAVKLRWWWLPRRILFRDAYMTWRSREWWTQGASQLVGRGYWSLTRLGLWDCHPGGVFRDGRWRWDFWRSPRSVWRARVTALEQLLAAEREHAKYEYQRGFEDGQRAITEAILSSRWPK